MKKRRHLETQQLAPPENASLASAPVVRETQAEATARATLARIRAAEDAAKAEAQSRVAAAA